MKNEIVKITNGPEEPILGRLYDVKVNDQLKAMKVVGCHIGTADNGQPYSIMEVSVGIPIHGTKTLTNQVFMKGMWRTYEIPGKAEKVGGGFFILGRLPNDPELMVVNREMTWFEIPA